MNHHHHQQHLPPHHYNMNPPPPSMMLSTSNNTMMNPSSSSSSSTTINNNSTNNHNQNLNNNNNNTPNANTISTPIPNSTSSKLTHPEWGVMKEDEFHPLAHKHQRDLENLYQSNSILPDFYFWQANLGGYCMADMVQNIVVSADQVFVLVRKIVQGAPHPGRKKKTSK
ncbi:hypothetical protein BJ944DRAFT_266208 [Cunninghamella echinulata]|nr:hypothetical protein BJ944DRAFT_266208 [Cunninghamella echinulata]